MITTKKNLVDPGFSRPGFRPTCPPKPPVKDPEFSRPSYPAQPPTSRPRPWSPISRPRPGGECVDPNFSRPSWVRPGCGAQPEKGGLVVDPDHTVTLFPKDTTALSPGAQSILSGQKDNVDPHFSRSIFDSLGF